MALTNWSHNWEEENLEYYEGLNLFKFWIGPRIDPNKANKEAEEINAAVKRVFQRNNLIKQCVNRHVRALVGKPVAYFLKDASGDRIESIDSPDSPDTPTPQTPAAEAELLLQRWFDRVYSLASTQECKHDDPFKEAVKNVALLGYGDLRVWSPKKFRDSPDLTKRVAIHAPAPGTVEYLYDDDGFLDRINYHYRVAEKDFVESQFIDVDTNETVFETLDEKGVAIADPETGETQIRLDLGGRYTIYRISATPLLNESIKDAQNSLNFTLTMKTRNLEQAGFLERLILGAQPPGHWEDVNGTEKFIPDPNFRIGVGQTAFLQGTPIYDADGTLTGYSNPSVQYREPVDLTTFEKAIAIDTTIIYHQFGQGHLLSSDLNMSGIARVASRQDFDTILEEHRTGTQNAVAGIMGAALMLMAPDSTKYRSLDVAVQLRFSTSKPLPEELDQNRQDYQAGLKSRTTAMAFTGCDDPDSEAALIAEEKAEAAMPDRITQLATLGQLSNEEVVQLLQQVGAVPAIASSTTSNQNQVLNPTNATANFKR